MRYQNYTLLDFLEDDEFKNWVLNPNESNDLFWREWLKAHPEKESDFRKARELILTIRFKEDAQQSDKYDVLRKILKGEKTDLGNKFDYSKKPRENKIRLQNYWKVAASLLLILGLSFLIKKSSNNEVFLNEEITEVTKQNPKGRKSTFQLPDGSLVTLNAESTLRYPSEFDSASRIVTLDGEAFFEVQEDPARPFTVIAKETFTTALGTAFNIRARQENTNTQIALLEGKVMVDKDLKTTSGEGLILTPGEKANYDIETHLFKKTSFDPIFELGWKDGILVFHHASLADFIQEIERWYDVKVSVEGNPAPNWSIDGKFDNESLREILEGLSYTYKIEYTLDNENVTLML